MAILRTLDLWTKSIFLDRSDEEEMETARTGRGTGTAEPNYQEMNEEELAAATAVHPLVERAVGHIFGLLQRVLAKAPDLMAEFADGLHAIREFQIGADRNGWRFRGVV